MPGNLGIEKSTLEHELNRALLTKNGFKPNSSIVNYFHVSSHRCSSSTMSTSPHGISYHFETSAHLQPLPSFENVLAI